MQKLAAPLRVLAALSVAFASLVAVGCDEETESDSEQFACIYDYSVYSNSEYGSSYDDYPDNCVTVSSREECDAYTNGDTTCAGTSCSDYSYYNVELVRGSCGSLVGGGDDYGPADSGSDNGSSSGSSSCEWTYDGECDEPEGTGACAEGTDSYDCSSNTCEWAYDGECDEPEGTGACAEGTDSWDC